MIITIMKKRIFIVAVVTGIVLAVIYTLCQTHYMRVFYAFDGPPTIAQISISAFRPELVRQYRVPYILTECIPSTKQLVDIQFKYHALLKRPNPNLCTTRIVVTKGMYSLLYSLRDRQHVDLVLPSTTSALPLRVKLCKGRVLIIPPHWLIRVSRDFKGELVHIYDLPSLIACITKI